MGRSRKKNEDGFTESQLEKLSGAYFIISNNIPHLPELKKNNPKRYKVVLGLIRSLIFDNSFFKTGLKSEAAIELEKKLKSMTKEEKDRENVKKNDAYKFTDEHPVNRVVISGSVIYLMMIKVIASFEQYVEFLRKYNVTIKITKLEHNSLSGTTGYQVKGIEDYEGRNVFVLGLVNLLGGMDNELLLEIISDLNSIED